MVELALNLLDETLMPHCYVAMRVGDSQKIGRLSTERMYKFPDSVVGEHRYAMLDVFQRIGGCTVSIKPKVDDQDVNLNTKAGQLRFRVSTPSSKSGTKSPRREGTLPMPKKLEVAKAYLVRHNLELRLKEAMQHVINELPDDPVAFIHDRMRESEGIVCPLCNDFAGPSDDLSEKPLRAMLQQEPRRARSALLPFAEYYKANFPGSEIVQACASRYFSNPKGSGNYKIEGRAKVVDHEVLASISELKKEIAERKECQAKLAIQVSEATKSVQSLTKSLQQVPRQQEEDSRSARKRREAAKTDEEMDQNNLRNEEFKEDLTEDQIEQIERAFSRFDRFGDGTIPKHQLGDVLRSLGQALSEEEIREILLEEVDIDDTGMITFQELLSVMARRAKDAQAEQELVEAFKLLDHSKSGYIKIEALRCVLTSIGESFTDEEVDDMLKDAKLNKDGGINYAVFAKAMVSTDVHGEL